MKMFKKSKSKALSFSTILLVLLMAICLTSCTAAFSSMSNADNFSNEFGAQIKMDETNSYVVDFGGIENVVNNYTNKYVVVRNQADLGSHYAYNENRLASQHRLREGPASL